MVSSNKEIIVKIRMPTQNGNYALPGSERYVMNEYRTLDSWREPNGSITVVTEGGKKINLTMPE